MPGGIRVPHGIIRHIREAIEALRVRESRHQRIRAQEATEFGRIESCIIVINAQLRDVTLTGVQAVGEHRAGRQARFPEGIVTHFSHNISAGVGRGIRRAEAVFEDVVHVPIDAHGAPDRNQTRR